MKKWLFLLIVTVTLLLPQFTFARSPKCNCFNLVTTTYPKIRMTKQLRPYNFNPHVGDVVIEKWLSKLFQWHFSLVAEVTDNGVYVREWNFKSCRETKGRFIPWNSKHLVGFWTPT